MHGAIAEERRLSAYTDVKNEYISAIPGGRTSRSHDNMESNAGSNCRGMRVSDVFEAESMSKRMMRYFCIPPPYLVV